MDYRGRLWQDYVFIPQDNALVFLPPHGYGPPTNVFKMDKLLMVTNITKNEIIYQPQIEGKGFTQAVFPYMVFEFDCSSMDKTDELQIFVEVDYVDLESLRTIAEARAQQTQVGILKTLLKIEKQLEIMTDEQIGEDDISGPGQKRK